MITILEVCKLYEKSEILNFKLEYPTKGVHSTSYVIKFSGWVIFQELSVQTLEFCCQGKVIKQVPVKVAQPKATPAHSDGDIINRYNFWTILRVLELPLNGEIVLQAVVNEQTRLPIATIKFSRQPLQTTYQPQLQPLLVTSLGRTGSTWMMRLLSEHPQISIYKAYPYEVRAAQYWISLLSKVGSNSLQLLQDKNYTQILHVPKIFSVFDSCMSQDFFVEEANTYIKNIDKFYQEILTDSESENRSKTQDIGSGQTSSSGTLKYFAEKYSPGTPELLQLTLELYPQAKELILVRDFRDMICSMIAFNQNRGYQAFGREKVHNDEQFVLNVIKKNSQSLLQRWKQRKDQAFLIRYEDLVSNPLETLCKVFEYCEIESSQGTVELIIQQATKDRQNLQTHLTSNNSDQSIGRWKTDLTSSLQEICQTNLQEVLEEFGYSV